MPLFLPGDIWLADLGYAAKVRPVLLLSGYPADDELALVVVVPHTTAIRGNRWEVTSSLSFLKPGVFHLQQIQPVPLVKLIRRLGVLPLVELSRLRARLVRELNL